MSPLIPPLRKAAVAAASLAVLASCASLTFSVDRDARAPRLPGFGRSDMAVATRVPAARELFHQGVLQAYAFNENEAVRMFKAALAQDPDCVLCAWGVAWQLGPNINDPDRDRVPQALPYVDHALRRLDGATPRERALVESLALRYAHASTARETAPLTGDVCGKGGDDDEKAHPLDVAYAQRMRGVADAYPDDADILALYAEAEMIATEGSSTFDKAGKPAGRMGEVADRLERLLARQPDHTGLNHYMIHVLDAQSVAARAVPAADRLGALAPSSPHLVHMPSHIYVHVGRYTDAARVNESAVAADAALAETQKAQGFSTSKDWRGHNLHFLWYAAVMGGREDLALATAQTLTGRARGESTFAEYVRSLPLITLVRLERWERVLEQPQPRGDKGLAQAWYEHARGVAQARLGRIDEAQASLARLQAAATKARQANASQSSSHKTTRAQLDVAEGRLLAELALARQAWDEALSHQAKVVTAAAKLDAREPPMLADGTHLTLGEIQARAGRWADAEKTYRQALADHPGSGWALRGLEQALGAQGRQSDAAVARRELDRSWELASPHLRGKG